MNLERREPDALRSAIEQWAGVAMPDARAVRITAMTRPDAGLSSETHLLDVLLGKERRPARWVLRIEPRSHQIYEDPSVVRQFDMMQALRAHGALPIPAPLAIETDEGVIGAPFFLMERAVGIAPPNDYHRTGLFVGIRPAEREALWLESLAALATLHSLDPAPFAFLGFAGGGDAISQELARWDSYRSFIGLGTVPPFDRARRWLEDHRPATAPPGLAWGDARPCNILYDSGHVSALLDWETASLGGAESDLGWWIFYDELVAEAEGVPRLAGIGDRTDTIAAWEQFSGRKALAMDWHILFAAYRFALICERAITLSIAAGRIPATASRPRHAALVRLEQLLAEA